MLVKDELLDKVVARIREQMPEDQAPQVEEFARQYYEWVDAADLEDRSPIDAYGAHSPTGASRAGASLGSGRSGSTTPISRNTAGSRPTL